MSSKLRRFELLLPLRFNDGAAVPREWFAQAAKELVARFGAVSYETQEIEANGDRQALPIVTPWSDLSSIFRILPSTGAG